MSQRRDQLQSQDSLQLTKSSLFAIAGVLLSRASGVLRTAVITAVFGAGAAMDSFNAAFRFPNALRDLFADGALSSAFTTTLVEAKLHGPSEERQLMSIVMGFFLCLTLSIATLGAIFAKPFMGVLVKDPHNALLAGELFQILAFYLPFTMLNAVAMASLSVLGKTFQATNSTLFLSAAMVFGSLVLAPWCEHHGIAGIFGLAVGSLLGVACQFFYQITPLVRRGLLPFPQFSPRAWYSYKPLRRILVMMGPRFLGQGALTLALLINTVCAINAGSGVMTYIATTVLIIQVPIGLFGVATSFAALPVLTRALRTGEHRTFSALFTESLGTSCWFSTFTVLGFALFIVPFYQVLFEHGKITHTDTLNNAYAVCLYAAGIIFSSASKILVNGFYSMNRTAQVVYNAFFYLAISASLTLWLAPRYGILGLGISYVAATAADFTLNAFFLRRCFQKQYGSNPYVEAGHAFPLKLACFCLANLSIAGGGAISILAFWRHTALTFHTAFLVLAIGGSLYAICAGTLLYFWGPPHLRMVLRKKVKSG